MLTYLRSKLKIFCNSFLPYRQTLMFVALFVVIVGAGSFILPKPALAFDIIDWPSFPDTLIRALSTMFLGISRLFLKIALFFLEYVIIVAGYNGYLDSTAVNVGWITVLNITNMLFVVILLIIAFATILGRTEYEWKKLLPKFFFAAILVNFSRTICGFLIDMSQVMMSAFVNAIAATIGGNVINGFHLDKIEKFNSAVKPGDLLAPGIFTASIAAVFFSAMVAAVFGAYIFILVGRMIRLWILIVLSPLAFVLSVIPKTQGFASQWWSELGDNLVTGPVLLFFIWLSLVTVGGGQINAHILAKSNVPDANKATMDGTLYGQGFVNTEKNTGVGATSEQSAGLTDILGWNNMANFIIAIGMLFAGAQVASKIGGSSGNLMMSAMKFGKKVATIATGVAAGEWAAGQFGKFAGKAPGYVGGLALSPIKRQAEKISGVARTARAGMELWQNKVAGNLEKVEGWKKPFARIGAWAIESGARKDKIAEDYTDLAEEAEKITKINYSTSSIGAGPAKLRMRELAEQEVRKSGAKKNQKFAEEEQKMIKIAQNIEDEKQKLKSGGLDEDQINARLSSKFSGRELDYHASRIAAVEGAAKAEIVSSAMALDKTEFDAEAKAKILEKSGEYLKADATRKAASNTRFEKSQEPYKSLNYTERLAQEEFLINKIQAELGKGANASQEVLKNLRKQRIALAASNTLQGAETGRNARYHALDKLGFFEKEGELNDSNRFRAELSRQLGEYIAPDAKIEDAINKWKSTFDSEKEQQAALRGLSGAYKSVALQGDESVIGLIKEEITPKGVVHKWEEDNSLGTTAYFADRASKVDKISTMGNVVKTPDGSFVLNGFSDRGIAAVSNFYSGKNTNGVSSLDGSVHSSWNEANVDEKNIKGYVNALLAMEKGMKPDGFETQLQYTKEFLGKLVQKMGGLDNDLKREVQRFVQRSGEQMQTIVKFVQQPSVGAASTTNQGGGGGGNQGGGRGNRPNQNKRPRRK